MLSGRDAVYAHSQLVRDITYLFHECAEYESIYGDNDFWSLLRGPYYHYFEEGDGWDNVHFAFANPFPHPYEDEDGSTRIPSADELFLQAGSVLMFLSMLCDWKQGSGYAFGTHGGECRHPLPLYVQSVLRAYRRVRYEPEHPTRSAYIAVLATLGVLDHARRRDLAQSELATQLTDTELLTDVRELIAEDGLALTQDQWVNMLAEIYDRYIRSYFAERSKPRELPT